MRIDADSDPAYHLDADPDLSFQIKAQLRKSAQIG